MSFLWRMPLALAAALAGGAPTWFAVFDHAREAYIATVDWDNVSVTFAVAPETKPVLLVVPDSGPLSEDHGMISGTIDDAIGMTKQ